MSLEKFQATDAWRKKFKNLLFTERKPSALVANSASILRTPQRLSFELSEDLQVILEEKKIPRGETNMPRVRDVDENKENCEEKLHTNTPTKLRYHHKADMTLVEDNDVLQVTNTSFETLEEMCEKTASDPDSTLFRYLNRESTSMHQATRAALGQSHDDEADALQRLLDELNVEETEKRLREQMSCNDTQLDDIEAPSRFWENTLTAETLQSISPVKMVGLMRQSTIMEECSVTESEESSLSYQSALKTGYSSETTGCYETASETATCSEKKVSINSSGSSISSDVFQHQHSRRKFFDDNNAEEELAEKSLHLMEFDKTIVDPLIPDSPDSPESSTQSSPDEIEDSLEPLIPYPETTGLTETEDSMKSSPECTQLTESEDGSSSIIELSDDDSAGCSKILEKIEKLQEKESVLNRSFTIKSEDENAAEEKSLHFNDTMEEVEYMMKKGMQYMEAAKDTPASPAKTHLTPVKKSERYRSPSPMLSSPITPKTVIAKPKPVNKFALDIKPFPKLELFKKPQVSGLKAPSVQNKFVSSVKRQQFAHVVSPIGAYIHKTSTTPLVSTIKPGCESTVNSKAFKQLEYDSRVAPQGAATTEHPSYKPCSLPKKAYISSEFKHITDERTQITIPGGPKIQRYLHNSMIPAVVRHEGKAKIPTNLRTSDMEPPAPRRTDDSLANLSLMSGDVSVYTIKDAQKFS